MVQGRRWDCYGAVASVWWCPPKACSRESRGENDACEENADGREQRKKEEITKVSIDTCLPPNCPHGDVHRCHLRPAFSSQALSCDCDVVCEG